MSYKPIANPYTDSSPPLDTTKGAAKLGTRDKYWFTSRFPFVGADDKILSTLYSYFIQHLRNAIAEYHAANPTVPFDHAWEPNHPYWDILRAVLQRFAPGQPAGRPGPRDDGRAADGVCQTHGGATVLRPNPQGESERRGGGNPQTEEESRSEVQRRPSDGAAVPDPVEERLKRLFEQAGLSLDGISD